MRIRPENVRLKSKVFAVSLPLEIAQMVLARALKEEKTSSRLIAEMVVDSLGANLDDLRGPGNPRHKEPGYWEIMQEEMAKAMGGDRPSMRDLKKMFPKPVEAT